jgi:tRNA(fMet)-specific endonuclease VapC
MQYQHPNILQNARRSGASNIFVTTVTLEEQLRGRLAGIGRAATQPDRLAIAHKNLRQTLDYFCSISLLTFNDAAYEYYQSLVLKRIRIGTQDLRIAAIALAQQKVIVTRNHKDFCKVPGLLTED